VIVVCIAGGPSLLPEDVEYCQGRASVMVVNDGCRAAPWADWMYAADYDWWLATANGETVPNHRLPFAGERWTCDPAVAEQFGARLVPHDHTARFADRRPGHVWGSNGGIEALILAQQFEPDAERYVLLGYDMGGSGHWFGDHPSVTRTHPHTGREYTVNLERTAAADFPEWCREFEQIDGRRVVNASRVTALTCFPRVDLRGVL
jgi:hypothetical protein